MMMMQAVQSAVILRRTYPMRCESRTLVLHFLSNEYIRCPRCHFRYVIVLQFL